MTARYLRLLAAGFRPVAARALAAAGFDVVGFWPFGWVS
jgi:hypothetical protein